jgi:hypothetical protein
MRRLLPIYPDTRRKCLTASSPQVLLRGASLIPHRSSCLTALRRFFGKTCRCDAGSAVDSVADGDGGGEAFPAAPVEKRSGQVC